MKAKEMVWYRRYKIKGHIFRAVRKQGNNFLVHHIKDNYDCLVPFEHNVEEMVYIPYCKERISVEDMNKFIEYIKNKYWYKEKKIYLSFLWNRRIYKLLYKSRKILTRNMIIGAEYRMKYKNKYYSYELNKFIDWFMKHEK